MTLEEKIEVIKAFSEGKAVEIYTIHGWWEPKVQDVWDFEKCKYRVKPEQIFKFKVNDNLVYKGDENKPSPTIYTVTNIDNTGYTLSGDEFEKSPSIIEKEYISERDVLWYFEIYGYISKEYSMYPKRTTRAELEKEFGPNHYTLSWQPIYALGFKLKEN